MPYVLKPQGSKNREDYDLQSTILKNFNAVSNEIIRQSEGEYESHWRKFTDVLTTLLSESMMWVLVVCNVTHRNYSDSI